MENEEMRAAEIQRFLNLAHEEGKSELEAYRALMKVIGVEYPREDK